MYRGLKEVNVEHLIKEIEKRIDGKKFMRKKPKLRLADIIRIFIYSIIFIFIAHLIYKGSKHVVDYKQPSQKQLIHKNELGDNCA